MSLYDDLYANAPKASALDNDFENQSYLLRDRGEGFVPFAFRHAAYDRSYFKLFDPSSQPGVRVEMLRQDDPEPSVLVAIFTDRSFKNDGQDIHILVDNLTHKTIQLLSPRKMELRGEAESIPPKMPDDEIFGARCVQTYRVLFGSAERLSIEVITKGNSLFYDVFEREILSFERAGRVPTQKGRFIGLDNQDLIGWVDDGFGNGLPVEVVIDQIEKSVYFGCFPLAAYRKKARSGARLFRIPLGALPIENRQPDNSILTRVVLRGLGETEPLMQGAFRLLRRDGTIFWWRMRKLDNTRMVGTVVCLNRTEQEVTVTLNGVNGGEVWCGKADSPDPQDLSFRRLLNSFEILADIPEELTITFAVKGEKLKTGIMQSESFKR